MRILLVAHGYPPRETAGTERHTHALAQALQARGHAVHVVAATRAPGRRPWELLEEPGVTRVVQNLTARPLAEAEGDAVVERRVAAAARRFRPNVVHVHHLQFLSAGLRFDAPVVYTLHDGWTWCAAGGQELLPGGAPCPGPRPTRCAPCAAAWAPRPARSTQALARAAGRLSAWVDPDTLYRWYRRLPHRLRPAPARGEAPPEGPEAAALRNAALAAFARASTLTAPSAFLARKAEGHGLGPVRVVPHGVALEPAPRTGDGPLLFLGTVAHHKGPDRVVAAWRAAFPAGAPGLALHGPVQDARLALGHPLGGPLDRAGVRAALAGARALVMASRWDENAPLVLLEARAAGCPVVAPRRGGIPELVEDGVDGFLFEPDDDDALARAMRRVCAAPLTPRPPRALSDQVDDYLSLYAEVAR